MIFRYLFNTECFSREDCDRLLPLLPAGRRLKAEKYSNLQGLAECIGGSLLLRYALKTQFHLQGTPEVAETSGGKPFLPEASHISFNISHSHGLVFLAAAEGADLKLGADIEGPRTSTEKLYRHTLSENEVASMASLPAELRDGQFTRIWTIKEAYVKMLGTGLRKVPADLETSITMDSIAITDLSAPGKRPVDCYFHQERLSNGYWLTVCSSCVGSVSALKTLTLQEVVPS